MIVVDTTVWIDYFRGATNTHSAWLEAQAGQARIGLTDLSLCEVLQGIRDEREFALARAELLTLNVFETGGVEFAIQAAENFRTLRRKGYTIRRIADCWIATFCIRERHELLHRDRDFDPFEKELGLRVIHP